MTVYLDTSVLAAYYCPEPSSERVEVFLTKQVQPVVSALTEVEFYSAVSRKVRERALQRKDATRITSKFMGHLDGRYYSFLPVERHHYRLARDWIGMFNLPLRTLDALHLAICSSEGLDIVTSDPGLLKSAKALSLNAIFIEP